MFLGRYTHAIDEKGRLAIPARFREAFRGQGVLTRGIDRCLTLYPMASWQPLAEKVSSLSISDPDARAFRRMVFAEATVVDFDRQGRILIPPELREYAGLDREAIVVGVHSYIEIWSPGAWATQAELLAVEGPSIAQRLASLI